MDGTDRIVFKLEHHQCIYILDLTVWEKSQNHYKFFENREKGAD